MAIITAVTAGDWNTASTWDLGRIPDVDDDVVIGGLSVTITNLREYTVKSITINLGGELQNGINGTIINGDVSISGGTLTCVNYGSYSINGDVSISGGTLACGYGSSYSINGDVSISGGTLTCGTNSSYSINGDVSISGGTLTGTFQLGENSRFTIEEVASTKNITIYASSSNVQNLNLAKDVVVSGGTLTCNNVTLNGDVSISGGTLTCNNVTLNGDVSISGGTLTCGTNSSYSINGDVSISGGTLTCSSNSSYSINGDVSISGGTWNKYRCTVVGNVEAWHGDCNIIGSEYMSIIGTFTIKKGGTTYNYLFAGGPTYNITGEFINELDSYDRYLFSYDIRGVSFNLNGIIHLGRLLDLSSNNRYYPITALNVSGSSILYYTADHFTYVGFPFFSIINIEEDATLDFIYEGEGVPLFDMVQYGRNHRLNYPTERQVAQGVEYGLQNEYEGRLALPQESTVLKDVEYGDDKVGTLEVIALSGATATADNISVVNLTEQEVERVKNCATVSTVQKCFEDFKE